MKKKPCIFCIDDIGCKHIHLRCYPSNVTSVKPLSPPRQHLLATKVFIRSDLSDVVTPLALKAIER